MTAPGASGGGAGTGADPRGLRLALRLPIWAGSIRFRLAVLYSMVLFAVAAMVVIGLYVALAQSLADEPVSQTADVGALLDGGSTSTTVVAGTGPETPEPDTPEPDTPEEAAARAQLAAFEADINGRTLEQMRAYSTGALLVFLVASLSVGWLIAAWVLKPIERITSAAQEIQATDLTQRIHLGGPDDELRHLADTFDDLLGRIDDAFEAQRRLIAEVSHELRNPLATIRTNLEVTLGDPDVGRDELLHTAAVVDRSADRMSKLVDDLLATARNEVPALAMETIDASVIVREAAEEFAGPAAARHLTVDGTAPDGLWVVGDRVALKQCLANLLANAVRLAPEGSTVRVRGGRSGGWVYLAVEDEGPGIPLEDQERVFQRFWRNNPRDRDQGRSGLGLSIVRQIAEAHRGDVGLVSSLGDGSTFSVRLPAADPAADTPVDPDAADTNAAS